MNLCFPPYKSFHKNVALVVMRGLYLVLCWSLKGQKSINQTAQRTFFSLALYKKTFWIPLFLKSAYAEIMPLVSPQDETALVISDWMNATFTFPLRRHPSAFSSLFQLRLHLGPTYCIFLSLSEDTQRVMREKSEMCEIGHCHCTSCSVTQLDSGGASHDHWQKRIFLCIRVI